MAQGVKAAAEVLEGSHGEPSEGVGGVQGRAPPPTLPAGPTWRAAWSERPGRHRRVVCHAPTRSRGTAAVSIDDVPRWPRLVAPTHSN
eukprot:9550502-Alexandrium_andersonii.AAC.1